MSARMSLLPSVFEELEEEHDILCLCHRGCCISCATETAEEEAAEMGLQGFVFFTPQDTYVALQTGRLWMGFGGLNAGWFDHHVGRKLQSALQDTEMTTTWNGSGEMRMCVELEPEDKEFLETFVEADIDDSWADDIRHFRLRKAWTMYKTAVAKIMSERSLVADSFEAWSLLPGGPVFKRARTAFWTAYSH